MQSRRLRGTLSCGFVPSAEKADSVIWALPMIDAPAVRKRFTTASSVHHGQSPQDCPRSRIHAQFAGFRSARTSGLHGRRSRHSHQHSTAAAKGRCPKPSITSHAPYWRDLTDLTTFLPLYRGFCCLDMKENSRPLLLIPPSRKAREPTLKRRHTREELELRTGGTKPFRTQRVSLG